MISKDILQLDKSESNFIKIVAMLTMLIDHIGFIFFTDIFLFRLVGRIAYPLFAFQIAVGAIHTRSFKRYLFNLAAMAVALQILLYAAVKYFQVYYDYKDLNIFFTLAVGLILVKTLIGKKYHLTIIILLVPFALEKISFNLEYGLFGLSLFLIFYLFKDNIILVIFALFFAALMDDYYSGGDLFSAYAAFSVLFIAFPLSINIKIPKWIFYSFYPLHIIFLYLISLI